MPFIEQIIIKNYKLLQNVTLTDLQPINVVLGPNGTGKSTLFDVFGFLAECLQSNVRKALESRGRFHEVRSRNSDGPISFTIKYREADYVNRLNSTPITYHISIDEKNGRPYVSHEYLHWRRGKQYGSPYKFLDIKNGEGMVITGENPEEGDERHSIKMDSPDILAIKSLGQLAEHPRVASLRRFIEGWFLSYFIPDKARQIPESGVAEHLSRTGDNLANVVQYLSEEHPDTFEQVLARVADRIPGLQTINSERTVDGRLVLQFKDGPFRDPFLAKHVSDGTLKMFAYLILLYDPTPPPLLCVEEPENGLHPRLLSILAEEFRAHARGGTEGIGTQVFVSSHSPYFIDALKPEELWIMSRNEKGYSTIIRADKISHIPEFIAEGASLGNLWYEGYFGRGNG
ncbi:AAA family ATPase [Gorillibacterium sp. CAU 1737]|uniref:AAA family ATPase n=1 Tax=Gorillibacterium sp. CAU 1737 TaxID=3140362 RepID=UPI0032603E1F